jgi:hypothetical protein
MPPKVLPLPLPSSWTPRDDLLDALADLLLAEETPPPRLVTDADPPQESNGQLPSL